MKRVVGEALELPESTRESFVSSACDGDDSLLIDVRELLAASQGPTRVLEETGIPQTVLTEAFHASPVCEGAVVGKYTIGRMLGSGGMGSVFEASDSSLGRRVALKLLSLGVASTGARRRFEKEARALARLDHPGIARVYEAGVEHVVGQAVSVPYFAMEYVEAGVTLDSWIARRKPSINQLLSLFAKVCDAVHHGHQKGVLHRDLKPSNILVCPDDHPKIIDFGVSRLLGEHEIAGATRSGDVVGTPAYMPPEAFESGALAVDTRADVYGIGVVLYEALAGRHPLGSAGLTPLEAGERVRGKPPSPLTSCRQDCSAEVETIVAKATARELEDRYQSAAEFAADLRRVLNFEPILARPAPLLRQASLFARRHRTLVGATIAIGAALTVGVAGLAVGLARSTRSEKHAKQEAERARRSSAFVMEMLRSASPFRDDQLRQQLPMAEQLDASVSWPEVATPGRAPTLGDLLIAANEQLATSFPDDPPLQADMAAVLAQTGLAISDPRVMQLVAGAAELLELAYGKNDRRAVIARQNLYSILLVNNIESRLPDIARDLEMIRTGDFARDHILVRWAAWHYLEAMRQSKRTDEAVVLLRELREELDRASPADDACKIDLDLALLAADSSSHGAALGLGQIPGLLARARALEPTPGQTTLSVLFHKQLLQRNSDDSAGALETLREGVAISSRLYGGKDQTTYEWWSHIWFLSMTSGDMQSASDAARAQVRGAEATLGPRSHYTTKAYGRLARSLLGQGEHAAEAERAAWAAIWGAKEMLDAGDGWSIYHELLWAWAIRLQGEPERAKRVIEERLQRETEAGRAQAVEWVEILRWTELAQCEMDIAAQDGTLGARAESIARHLERAEGYAAKLDANWPSSLLVREARARFESGRVAK